MAITEYLKVIFSANQSDLDKFNKGLKDADKAAEELNKGLDEVGKNDATDKLADGFDKVVTGVKAFIALQIVQELGRIAVGASKVAAEAEGIQSAFRNLGGSSAELKKLSDAVGGTVDNIELMKFAVQALQKGLTFDQITKAAEGLNKQANATGKSFQELGVKALKSMTDIPSFMEEIIKTTEELGDVVGDTGDAYAKFEVAQKNLTLAFGNFVNSGAVQETLNGLSSVLNGLAGLSDAMDSPLEKAKNNVADLNKEIEKLSEGLNSGSARVRFKSKERIDELTAQVKEQQGLIDAVELAHAKDTADKKAAEELAIKTAAEDKLREEAAKAKADKDAAAYAKAIRLATEKAQKETQTARLDKDRGNFVQDSVSSGMTDLTKMFSDDIELKTKHLSDTTEVISESFEEIPKATDKVKDDFDSALFAAVQIIGVFDSLNEDSSPARKFIGDLVKAVGAIVSILPGGQIAGTIISVFGGAFNEGGMVGKPTGANRDSVLAALTLGEFVTNRDATQRSPLLLDAINAGELDDRLFKQLTRNPVIVNVDQQQIVDAIRSIPQTDLYMSGSALIEVKRIASEKRAQRKTRLTV